MRRGLPLALSVCALPLLLAGAWSACGDDDANPGGNGTAAAAASPTPTAEPSDTQPSPVLAAPASKFSILLQDVGLNSFLTDIPATYELTAKSYGATKAFPAGQGEALLTKWHYVGGYETALIPEGRDTAILNGGYQIYVETHLFQSAADAKAAYDYLVNAVRTNGTSQPVTSASVGNESYATKTINGKIRTSTIDAAYHQIIFHRGNLVAIVLTYGADPFMKVDTVRSLAMLVDKKALGTVEAVAPTPTSNYTPPADRIKTPTATAATPVRTATAAR